MFANRYTALIDTCSLVSVWRRNLLLTLADAEFFRVRWSPEILKELGRALVKLHEDNGHVDAQDRAARAIASIEKAFPEALVDDYDLLAATSYNLPDKGDEHVVAAALKTQAQTIVTENLKHFPEKILYGLNMEARSADDFIADTIALEPGTAVGAIRRMRERLKRPEMTADEMLRQLEANGLTETASILAPHISSI